MCFYLYSPHHTITLRHVSEKISPKEKRIPGGWPIVSATWVGTSDIDMDLIIFNHGLRENAPQAVGDEIKKFFIVYPNQLFLFDKARNAASWDPHVTFRDSTDTFITDSYDRLARQRGEVVFDDLLDRNIVFQYVDHVSIDALDPAQLHYKVTLDLPDPNTLETARLESVVHGMLKIALPGEGSIPGTSTSMLYHIMRRARMTILECEFEYPLEKEEARWVRLHIEPRSTSSSTAKSFKRRWTDTFFNANRYPFEIKGPYNVRYEFFSHLDSFAATIGAIDKKVKEVSPEENAEIVAKYEPIEDYSTSLGEELENLKAHIGESKDTNTRYNDWRLEVFSKGGVISGIREYGIYKISGSLSRIVKLADKKLNNVFTWKAGQTNVCPKEDPFPLLCDRFFSGPNTCPSSPPCIPFAGNFKIAYDWLKSNELHNYLILGAILSGVYTIIRFGFISGFLWIIKHFRHFTNVF